MGELNIKFVTLLSHMLISNQTGPKQVDKFVNNIRYVIKKYINNGCKSLPSISTVSFSFKCFLVAIRLALST